GSATPPWRLAPPSTPAPGCVAWSVEPWSATRPTSPDSQRQSDQECVDRPDDRREDPADDVRATERRQEGEQEQEHEAVLLEEGPHLPRGLRTEEGVQDLRPVQWRDLQEVEDHQEQVDPHEEVEPDREVPDVHLVREDVAQGQRRGGGEHEIRDRTGRRNRGL